MTTPNSLFVTTLESLLDEVADKLIDSHGSTHLQRANLAAHYTSLIDLWCAATGRGHATVAGCVERQSNP